MENTKQTNNNTENKNSLSERQDEASSPSEKINTERENGLPPSSGSETGDYQSFRDAVLRQKAHYLFLAETCDRIIEIAPKNLTYGQYTYLFRIPK